MQELKRVLSRMEDFKSEDKQFEGQGKKLESKHKEFKVHAKELEQKEKQFDGCMKGLELREKQNDALIEPSDKEVELGKRSFSFSFLNNFISTGSCNGINLPIFLKTSVIMLMLYVLINQKISSLIWIIFFSLS